VLLDDDFAPSLPRSSRDAATFSKVHRFLGLG
jgi:hypothetical protein